MFGDKFPKEAAEHHGLCTDIEVRGNQVVFLVGCVHCVRLGREEPQVLASVNRSLLMLSEEAGLRFTALTNTGVRVIREALGEALEDTEAFSEVVKVSLDSGEVTKVPLH